MKKIHFYLDVSFMSCAGQHEIYTTYDDTEKAIDEGVTEIHTTSLANITFYLLDLGYKIFLHRNNRVLECKPGMDGTEKDIRYEHNIFRLIRSGHFDNYFNEKPYLDNSEFDYGHNVNHKFEEYES